MPGKSARYALHAALEMALSPDEPVTVASVAARFGIPPTALAKVFQQLVRSGLALGTRGVGGGYRLARRANDISVLDVLSAFAPPPTPGRCLVAERPDGACPRLGGCGLRQLFDEADELLRCTFASVSLETLARRTGPPPVAAAPAGARTARRPRSRPGR
ncbi:MAG: Rrf2 family transcriptional regulator [Vicinamibacteria bacterium]